MLTGGSRTVFRITTRTHPHEKKHASAKHRQASQSEEKLNGYLPVVFFNLEVFGGAGHFWVAKLVADQLVQLDGLQQGVARCQVYLLGLL